MLLSLFWRTPIDAVLSLSGAGYGLAILAVATRSLDGLARARLADALRLRIIGVGLGTLLLTSAINDAVVAADFAWRGGVEAPKIVSAASLIALLGLAWLVILESRRRAAVAGSGGCSEGCPAPPSRRPDTPEADDEAVLLAVTRLLRDGGLYRDADLTLEKLARRAAFPARAISAAVNRRHGQNVSQFVNGFRIAEARRMLESSDRPVTAIMFDAGFQTKSNFNREFRRVLGCSPTEWRRMSGPDNGARNGVSAAGSPCRPPVE